MAKKDTQSVAPMWDRFALRDARLRADLLQKDAAAKLGITAQWVSMIEKGHKTPSNALVARFAKLYNRNIADFFIAG